MQAPLPPAATGWVLENEVRQMEAAGFQLRRREEELLDSIFYDIGAVVFFLKIITWQIPDFAVEKYRRRLLALHEHIEKQGAFHAQAHRYLLEAWKR